MSGSMKPGQKTGGGPFVKGAALTPKQDLVAWFESQKRNGEPRLTRVPIVLKKGAVGFQLRGAKIGTAPDALEVFVSDAALGVGLADRARSCTEATCNFIVEGYWRGDAEAPGFYKYEARTASQQPVSADEISKITHAEVEGESGN